MKATKRMFAFLLAATMTLTGLPAAVKAEPGVNPEDGTTIGQPFPSGTGGSQNFRIPGIVTLNDGTLIAACDARWDHGGDACGLDTIVSRSTDNGKTWNYTFANYLGDNGNKYAPNSTAFIDPAITTDGETIYMIADVWPGGYAINTAPDSPIPGENGLDAEGNLRLSADNRSTYAYHLQKADEDSGSYYTIVENETGNTVDDYTIDAYFNITGNGIESNLFYSDSPYLVYPTDYLYLTTSKDGATWSVPVLLNLKKEAEQSFLVGPGRGIVTSSGRIVFTAYEFSSHLGGDRNSCCFYSDDQGETWTRGQSVKDITSEAAVVEADNKLYMFTRHGGYYVSEDEGETWSDRKDPGISYCLSCELSAITYSKKIDGKTAIILSAPSATSRAAGKLFIGLVQNDGSISWDYSYSVNGDAYYAYSCLTELNDGSIGLLYESAGTAITYTNIPIQKAAPGAFVGNIWCTDTSGSIVASVDMKSQSTVTLQAYSAGQSAGLKAVCDSEFITAALSGNKLTIRSSSITSGMERAAVTLTDNNNTMKLNINVTDAQQYEIVDLRMGDAYTIAGYNGESFSGVDTSVIKVTKGSESLKIEALSEGKTSVKLGSKEYFFVVKNDEVDLKLEIGESVTVPGAALMQGEDSRIVSTTPNSYPYEPITEIADEGEYLIGTASHIVTDNESAAGDPVGRAMQAADFYSGDLTEHLWTFLEETDGYTVQNKDGQYLSFNGSAVQLSDSPQTLSVTPKNSGFSVSYNGQYLNNYGNSNQKAAGYSEDNNTWILYQQAGSHTFTGLLEGRDDIIVSGTTYHITVGNPIPVDVEQALTALKQTISAADLLFANLSPYTDASVSVFKAAYNHAKNVLATPKSQTAASVNAARSQLEQAMKLEPKPADNNPMPPAPQPQAPELPAAGSTRSDKNATYKVISSKTSGGTVSYVKPKKKSAKTATIPASIQINGLTYKVTAIEKNALKGCQKLTQVTIGANVQTIGKSAFEGCKKIKKITIQSTNLKSVGKKAIKGIDKKCTIRVPKKKIQTYKKLFQGKGFQTTMKIVKK